MNDKTRHTYFAANRSKFSVPMYVLMLAANYAGYDQTDGMTTEEGVFTLTIARPATNANYCLLHRG